MHSTFCPDDFIVRKEMTMHEEQLLILVIYGEITLSMVKLWLIIN
jgi:hypothetical protein